MHVSQEFAARLVPFRQVGLLDVFTQQHQPESETAMPTKTETTKTTKTTKTAAKTVRCPGVGEFAKSTDAAGQWARCPICARDIASLPSSKMRVHTIDVADLPVAQPVAVKSTTKSTPAKSVTPARKRLTDDELRAAIAAAIKTDPKLASSWVATLRLLRSTGNGGGGHLRFRELYVEIVGAKPAPAKSAAKTTKSAAPAKSAAKSTKSAAK